jgi:hypothetical protein
LTRRAEGRDVPVIWLILLDVLWQQDDRISAVPPGPQQVPVRTKLKPVAKDGDVLATIVDVAGIVAHGSGQVYLHEQISSSISRDIRTTDREHLLVMECFQIDVSPQRTVYLSIGRHHN